MAIAKVGSPFLLATGTNTGGGVTSLTLTTSTTVPAGAAILVCGDSDLRPSYAAITGVSDSSGNTYSQQSGGNFGTNITAQVWAAFNVTALPAGSSITITWSGTSDVTATALACTGLAAAGALDQTAYGGETPNAAITLQSGPLGLASELALAYWVSRNAQGQPAVTSDWVSLAAFEGTNGVGHWVNVAYQIRVTADPVTATATTPAAGTGWCGQLVTFRAAINPTAGLDAGGSVTGFPVAAQAGTAALRCGGSILGPAELAPVPPPVTPVFPAGYGPLPADMGAWVRQSFAYVSNQTVFRAEQATGQALTAGAWNPVQFDTVTEDPWHGWSAVATSEQAAWSWLAPWTGLYRVTFRYLTGTVSGAHDAAVGVTGRNPVFEGGGMVSPASTGSGAGLSLLVPLIGGQDYVQLLAMPPGAATTDVTAPGRRPSVEITTEQTDLRA